MSESDLETEAASTRDDDVNVLDLPSGQALSVAEANSVLLSSFSRVILVAGAAESGKTTLLASIYCLFQEKPFAGYLFAGSMTLVGFENRLYFARMASRREVPTFERTTRSEYLHISVRREDLTEPRKNVLLCDLCSEDLREAKNNSAACREIEFFRRADYFVLLIDGDKLCDMTLRQPAKNEVTTLVRNFIETGVICNASRVDILFTKWDKVESTDNLEVTLEFVKHVEEEVRSRLEGKVHQVRFARIAAHPFESSHPLGHGLEEIFPTWVDNTDTNELPTHRVLRNASHETEFDSYYRKRLPERFVSE